MFGVKKKIRAVVGMMSLVGVRKKNFPLGHANYFSFGNDVRCLNMWAENLEEAVRLYLTDGMVEGWEFCEGRRRWFVVDDERLPEGWLYNKFCWTGSSYPSDIEMVREMYGIHGDPTGEILQIENPKKYWEDRGNEYITLSNGNSIIKQTIKAQPRKLKAEWTIETAELLTAIYDPDLEKHLTSLLSKTEN